LAAADQLAAWRGFMNLIQRLRAALEWQLQRDSQLSFILADLSGQVSFSAEYGPTHLGVVDGFGACFV
jgi:hypothetical protein